MNTKWRKGIVWFLITLTLVSSITCQTLMVGWMGMGMEHLLRLAFSPDGRTLAMGLTNGVELWDVETGVLLSTLPARGSEEMFRFLPDGTTLVTVDGLFDITTGKPKRDWSPDNYNMAIDCRSLSPDGSIFAFYNLPLPDFSFDKSYLRLVNLQVKQPERKLKTDASCPLAFSPDGRLLAIGGGPVELWGVPP